MSANTIPDLKMAQFEGPLDLLCHLIEKNKIDIHDIPIDYITDQYLKYLTAMQEIDLDLASDFLVMAAGLLQIKSRLLLPKKDTAGQSEDADPREELVLRLLEYRRCKTLANELKSRHAIYTACVCRLPESPTVLGLNTLTPPEPVSVNSFFTAARVVCDQNMQRFSDLSGRIAHILRRDKISLRDKMRQILVEVFRRTRVFFSELYPQSTTNRNERVVAFLALLELLHLDRIRVRQERPFDVILIETDGGAADPLSIERLINLDLVKEKDYA
jgi:segregation and condensation protein A